MQVDLETMSQENAEQLVELFGEDGITSLVTAWGNKTWPDKKTTIRAMLESLAGNASSANEVRAVADLINRLIAASNINSTQAIEAKAMMTPIMQRIDRRVERLENERHLVEANRKAAEEREAKAKAEQAAAEAWEKERAKYKAWLDGLRQMASIRWGSGRSQHILPARVNKHYQADPSTIAMWHGLVWIMHNRGETLHAKLTGDPGTGKTLGAEQFAAEFGLGFVKVDCSALTDPMDLFGMRMPTADEDGKMRYEWSDSPFSMGVETGYCVVLLDEISRLRPPIQNALLGLMDGTRMVSPPSRPTPLHLGPCVFFMATANEGSRHSGTYPITEALQSRFGLHWEQRHLSTEQLAAIGLAAAGMGNGGTTRPPYEFMPHGISEPVVRGLAGMVEALKKYAEAQPPGSGASQWFPSPREFVSLVQLYQAIGPRAIDFTILNRYPDVSVGSKSPRALAEAQIKAFMKMSMPPMEESARKDAVQAMLKTAQDMGASMRQGGGHSLITSVQYSPPTPTKP